MLVEVNKKTLRYHMRPSENISIGDYSSYAIPPQQNPIAVYSMVVLKSD